MREGEMNGHGEGKDGEVGSEGMRGRGRGGGK